MNEIFIGEVTVTVKPNVYYYLFIEKLVALRPNSKLKSFNAKSTKVSTFAGFKSSCLEKLMVIGCEEFPSAR